MLITDLNFYPNIEPSPSVSQEKTASDQSSPTSYRVASVASEELSKVNKKRAYDEAHADEIRKRKAASDKRYRDENKDRLAAKAHERYMEKKEERAQYYKENQSAIAAQQKEYRKREDIKEKRAELQRNYRAANAEKINAQERARRAARKEMAQSKKDYMQPALSQGQEDEAAPDPPPIHTFELGNLEFLDEYG